MDVFKLIASLTLNTDAYDKALKDSEGKASSFGSAFSAGISKAGAALKTVVKGVAVAAVATTTAVGALVKKSLDAYGNYEQLVGGVDTLFKDSSKKLQDYASEAYRTAGISANQYMETSIQFSAALINSLEGDTKKAADYANKAIVDMADNSNKMGTSLESIQNAYRGFSRGNFTMLDNLSLGFAGTKEGMQQLLDKANEYNKQNGIHTEYQIENYADIVDAIHVVQEQMGIAGATAEEASDTIQGSLGSLKGAWENLIAGLGNPSADISALVGNVVSAAQNVLKNVRPIISNILKALPPAFKQFVSEAKKLIPDLLNVIYDLANVVMDNLPDVIDIILDFALQKLPDMLERLIEIVPQLLGVAIEIAGKLIDSLITQLPTLIPKFAQLAVDLLNQLFSPSNIRNLIQALLDGVKGVIAGLAQALPVLVKGVTELIVGLIHELPTIIKLIVDEIPNIIKMIFGKDGLLSADNILLLVNGAIDVVLELVNAIPTIIGELIKAIPTIISKIFDPKDGFLSTDNIQKFIDGAIEIVKKIADPKKLMEIIGDLIKNIPLIIEAIVKAFAGLGLALFNVGKEAISQLWEGIKSFMQEGYDPNPDSKRISLSGKAHSGVGRDESPGRKYNLANNTIRAFDNTNHGYLMADGGIVTRPTSIIAGEAGAEAIIPLERNTGWIDQRLDQIVKKLSERMPSLVININNPVVREDEDINRIADAVSKSLADDILRSGMSWRGVYA